jgi:hypothetical protein
LTVQIREIDTASRGDVRRFVNFQFNLYARSDRWSPPLRSAVGQMMDRRRFPFYRRSAAAFFLAERDGLPRARVAVLDNRPYNEYRHSRTAFFTLFDAEDDVEAARCVLDAAADWAARRGLTALVGPKGFLRSDAPGVLVEGFDHEAALGMPYNYEWYPRLLEAAGFVKEVDYLSGYLSQGYRLPERLARIIDRVKERSGLEVRSFRRKHDLKRWIPALQRVNNEAFTGVWGYYPIDDAEARLVARRLLAIADPRLIKIVTKGDEIAGFLFIFPDISAALRRTGGRLWPWGWFTVWRALKTTRRFSGNGVGLVPQYQGSGGSALLYAEITATLTAAGAVHCDIAQALETNVKSLGDMNNLGVIWYKRHRVYRRAITPLHGPASPAPNLPG